jgi:TRAP transporter TAXI family solute receptor
MVRGLREPLRSRSRARKSVHVSIATVFAAACLSPLLAANAQDSRPIKTVRNDPAAVQRLGDQINQNTIAIMSGNPNATYLSIAYDLSAVLDDGDNFRVLPVVGKGGGQNLRDVRFLKGIDLGITQSNLLSRMRRTNEIGNLDDKIVYIAKLYNEEMHFVVRADSGIQKLEDLDGKTVNFSDIGSGTQLSTRDIFEKLGIKANEVNMGQNDAAVALKKGEIDATILIAGKPTGSTSKLKAADGFRLLPVAYEKPLQNDYLPAVLTHDDYPNLIKEGERVDTVAVGAVLIAYNWPKDTDRYHRIAKFVDRFFSRLAEFQKPPRHVKWKETNLAAKLPGWTRFPAAEEWLRNHPPKSAAIPNAERAQFNEYVASHSPGNSPLASAGTFEEREQLFREFLQWKQARDRR